MCEPVTIAAITVGVVAAASGTASAVEKQEQAEAMKSMSATKLAFDTAKIKANLESKAEQAAEQRLELARDAAEARGRVLNTGAGDNSIRALSRAVGFELGQDQATVDKNVRIANRVAADQLFTARMQHEQTRQKAGDTSGVRLGFDIAGALVGGVASGLSVFSGLGGELGTGSTPDALNAADVLPEGGLDFDTTFTDFSVT